MEPRDTSYSRHALAGASASRPLPPTCSSLQLTGTTWPPPNRHIRRVTLSPYICVVLRKRTFHIWFQIPVKSARLITISGHDMVFNRNGSDASVKTSTSRDIAWTHAYIYICVDVYACMHHVRDVTCTRACACTHAKCCSKYYFILFYQKTILY